MATSKAWYRDDVFWRDTYTFLFGEEVCRHTDEEADFAEKWLTRNPGRILDVCCGPGRHAMMLAGRGHHVTGVDASEYLIGKAREEATRGGATLMLLQGDAANTPKLVQGRKFDLAICLYTSIGLSADLEEDMAILQGIAECLEPGGKAVLDVMGKEVLARRFQRRDWITDSEDRILLRERRIEAEWTQIRNRWTLADGSKRTVYDFKHRVYDARELSQMVHEAGFNSNEVMGGFDGRPYDEEAQRLIVVAER